MKEKTRVAAYCRVSTDMEDQLNSLSAQIKYFTEYISGHENYELIEAYYDEGMVVKVQKPCIVRKRVQNSNERRADRL